MKTLVRDLPSKKDRDALLFDLAKCINKRVNKTITQLVLLRDWRWTDKRFELRERIGNPYPVCGLSCVAQVREWGRKKRPPLDINDIELVFEDGDEHRGEMQVLCEKELGVAVVLDGKKTRMPFQVGDLLAWSSRRDLAEMLGDANILHKPWLTEIRKAADVSRYFSRKHLIEFCEELGVPRRSDQS